MNELRQLRRDANVTQRELADFLEVPVNTFRMWDRGLRRPPVHVASGAREALIARAKRRELLPLAKLAKELGVHVRTLQAAARFMATWYRRTYGRGRRRLVPVCRVVVPADYAPRVVGMRLRLGLSQQQLAAQGWRASGSCP